MTKTKRRVKQQKRKKKSPPEHEIETVTSFLFPVLHQAVGQAIEDSMSVPEFHDSDDDVDVDRAWSTHIMGRFSCMNSECGTKTWGSKRIAILIRRYYSNEYNAVVFTQYCQSCGCPGAMQIDESTYIDRVAYRLKKWAGVKMEPPTISSQRGLPHKTDLCEGCRRGYCQKTVDCM